MATKNVSIPPFEATSIDDIGPIHNRLQATFRSNKTKDLDYRILQLRRFYWGIKDNSDLIIASLAKDLRKSLLETSLAELDWCLQDCLFAANNLKKWARDEKFSDVALQFKFFNARIRKEPLGTALIIGAYNFPINLTFGPLVGAIAAGCPAVIKPSESSPSTAMVMAKIVQECLDPDAYAVVNGAVPETTKLLDLKWDKIFYTGGGMVGKIVAEKAAKTLTPVTLELGGRNPAFITRNANLHLAARRLMWGKTFNAGQVCISHNYALVDRSVLPAFVDELKKVYNTFFPEGAKKSPDLSRIVNRRHFLRIKKMMDESSGTVVMGGETDESDLYIEPTAVQVEDINDPVIAEESFGPLWGIIPFNTLDDAIDLMHQVDRTPLALFCFGSKEEQQKVLNSCTSGGASMNDSFFHASITTLPFGGVGSSGTGSYRGKASFDAFTHKRSVTTTPTWIEKMIRPRYMPYDMKKYAQMTLTNAKPNFDRSGHVVSGGLGYWIKFVVGLGGAGAKGGSEGGPRDPGQEMDAREWEDVLRSDSTTHLATKPNGMALGDLDQQHPTEQLSRATTAAGEHAR